MLTASTRILNRVLRSASPRARRAPPPPVRNRPRLAVHPLEGRSLPSTYSVIDVGPITGPGASSQPFPFAGIVPGGTNDASPVQVVGQGVNPQVLGTQAFLWDAAHGGQYLGTVGGDAASASTGVNDSGQAVGLSYTQALKTNRFGDSQYTLTSQHAFLWTGAGGMQNLGNNDAAFGVNASGEVIGQQQNQPALWRGGWTGLGTLGGKGGLGYGINDYGQAVGFATTASKDPAGSPIVHAFLWTPAVRGGTKGKMVDLGALSGAGLSPNSSARAVNNLGFVTGQSGGTAFVWSPASPNGTSGTMIALPDSGIGNSLNDGGVVVGQGTPYLHAVVWQKDGAGAYQASDLNDLIPADTGWTLRSADSINAGGQIVVEATRDGISYHALLLTPEASAKSAAVRQAAATEPTASAVAAARPEGSLLVGSFANNGVLRYDEGSGTFIDRLDPHNLAGLKNPSGGVVGPDHNVYVSSAIFESNRQSVLQYDGATGAFRGVFASEHITSPRGVLFGPDGNLYVANGNSPASGDPASVERFDGKTGAFLDYFVAPNSGGLAHPSYMVFGPDGAGDGKLDLYVAATDAGSILRYDGTTGTFKGVFVAADSGGLNGPQGMAFGPGGDLYVASGNWFTRSNGPFYSGDFPPGAVLRFEGPSGNTPGAFLGTFVPAGSGGLANPNGIVFGPDPSGNGKTDLYVASSALHDFKAQPGTSEVLRYDGTTGAFLGAFVTPGSGGLRFPTFLTFTETDPTTLAYVDDGAITAVRAAALAAPTSLNPRQVRPLPAEADRRWNQTGLTAVERRLPRHVHFQIADLDGLTLGTATGTTITLDRDGAGWGSRTRGADRTPRSDREFARAGNQAEQGRMDLLTVFVHEVGYILGRDHGENGFMAETLAAGTRLTPTAGF